MYQTVALLLIGLVGGGFAGLLLGRRGSRGRRSSSAESVRQMLDLVRRAHGCELACLVDRRGGSITAASDPSPSPEVVESVLAAAKQSMVERRMNTSRDAGTTVSIGDGSLGAAVSSSDMGDAVVEAAATDLRNLITGLRLQRPSAPAMAVQASISTERQAFAGSVEGMAVALAEAARGLCKRPTVVVVRDVRSKAAKVVAVSQGVDRRLVGVHVLTDSAVGRACFGATPVEGRTRVELFGHRGDTRRRHDLQGVAFPLRDGQIGVGALVVLGPIKHLNASARHNLEELAAEGGPKISSAMAIRSSDLRVGIDQLTGLANRRMLGELMGSVGNTTCSLVLVQIDQLEKVSQTYGRKAGEAAIKHVVRILLNALRDEDEAGRVGESQFALWLPDAPGDGGITVAERVRIATETTPWDWVGTEAKLTLSVGVASCPDPVEKVSQLYEAADGALSVAKEKGNTVEVYGAEVDQE